MTFRQGPAGFAACGSIPVHLEGGDEGFLRDLDLAELAHPLLAFLLLLDLAAPRATAAPRVLFLDEGTANLDVQTEEIIADLIAQLPITRIVVAHRPALLQRADRVLGVEGGKLTNASIERPRSEPEMAEA